MGPEGRALGFWRRCCDPASRAQLPPSGVSGGSNSPVRTRLHVASPPPILGRGGVRWLSPVQVDVGSEALLEQEVGWQLCLGRDSRQARVPGGRAVSWRCRQGAQGGSRPARRAQCAFPAAGLRSPSRTCATRILLLVCKLPFPFITGFFGCAAF